MKYGIGIVTVCVAVHVQRAESTRCRSGGRSGRRLKSDRSRTRRPSNAQDAKALAEHWGAEAVYINPLTGVPSGRSRSHRERVYSDPCSAEGRKVGGGRRIPFGFIFPGVAVENGVAKLIAADGQPGESSYTAIHVKREGKWLLDRVTELELPVVLSALRATQDLEWMIGVWVDGDDQARIETTCQWTRQEFHHTVVHRVGRGPNRHGGHANHRLGPGTRSRFVRGCLIRTVVLRKVVGPRKKTVGPSPRPARLPDGGKASSVNVITSRR